MTKLGEAYRSRDAKRLIAALSGLALSCAPLAAASAQQNGGVSPAALAAAPTPAPASAAVVINLIRLLVQEGVLTQAKADALIRQAQDEAAVAARNRPPVLSEATRNMSAPPAVPPPPPPVHVNYVPEIVKNQIRDEVKQEVLQEAKAENWAAPNALPEWTKRFHPFGDFRLRYEWDLFDPRNSNQLINFQQANSGAPLDVTPPSNGLLPFLDTTANRERLRLRARLGTTIDVADGFTAGFRMATGNTTNPVSTNTTLGTDLNKDNFLLDLAYLKYQPRPWATFWAGRLPNPWFSTDLVWSTELAFDGIAAQAAPPINDQLTPFVTAGAFPIENTAFNLPTVTEGEQASRDKWLYGGQVGLEWHPHRDYKLKFEVAYYYFANIDGQELSPCTANTSNIPCSTDNSRPGFIQQGNTLFAIRSTAPQTTTPEPNGSAGAVVNYQYYGLASPFRELDATMQFDFARYDPVHVILDGDFVTNLGLNKNSINALGPVNGQAASPGNNVAGPWSGGGNGFMGRLTVGYPQINELWDWNFSAAYKYLEMDAVVDAFTDLDFHLGGTNAKGYIIGGNLGVAHNVYLTARWLSASEITSLPYTVNVVQLDLNAHF